MDLPSNKVFLPFVATPEEKVEKMVELAKVKKGQKSVDLGAGDGRIVIAFAKAGAKAYGFEKFKKYYRRALAKIASVGLQEKATIIQSDFWEEDLSSFDIVTVYGMGIIMADLGEKLTRELRPGTVVICNGFQIPNWEEVKEDNHLHLYIKK